jgi:NRPS condensation-like uncharacterized protein
MSVVRTPLTIFEEILKTADRPEEPLTIQTEYRVAGRLDADRLREALRTAIALHPMARARIVAPRKLLRPPQWEIGEVNTDDLIQSVRYDEDSEMDAARAEFYSRPIDLKTAPALRILVAHRPGGDSLLFSVNHTITDGIGSLRFLQSLARAYDGRPDPVPPIDALAARDLRTHFGPAEAKRLRQLAKPIIPKGETATVAGEGARGEPGYGFRQVVIPVQRQDFNPRRFGPSATTNDLMMAALHLTIDSWNAARSRPCDCISVLMPVNFRPMDWHFDVVGNLTLGGRIITTPAQRASPEALMTAVIDRSNWLKAGGGLTRLFDVPSWLYKLLPILISRLPRSIKQTRNSSVLTYFGRIDPRYIPQFGGEAGEIIETWGSPPVMMPVGVAVGGAIFRGRLYLGLRYRRALFDAGAAQRFTDLFLDHLMKLGRG